MPIYEYECRACGHDFDVLQKVTDARLRKCPECGALKLQRMVSAPQFRLKGTGWYETDFKKDGKKRLADAGEDKPAADKKEGAENPDKPTAENKKAAKEPRSSKSSPAAAAD